MFNNLIARKYYEEHRYDLMPCVSLDYSDRVAVIVEPRDEPLLRWTICNIKYYTQWPVIVYYSSESYKHLEGLQLKKTEEISPDFTLDDYNELLVSDKFWYQLPDSVLIFQTDSFMLRSGIEFFMNYDYVGAPWSRQSMEFSLIPVNIGNGGFSLRKRDKMRSIIKAFPNTEFIEEDRYFANGFFKEGGILPPMKIQKKFSVEERYYKKPLAVHAPWKAIDDDLLRKIL